MLDLDLLLLYTLVYCYSNPTLGLKACVVSNPRGAALLSVEVRSNKRRDCRVVGAYDRVEYEAKGHVG